MLNPRQRLIEAATRPLADNAEMKHAAADFLKNRITDEGDPAEAMVARWEQVDARKGISIWRSGLWVMVAVVSAAVVVADFQEIRRFVEWGKWLATGSLFTPLPESAVDQIASKLNESEKLLLFGDLTKESKAERKEALWRSEPENPAYFADYASAYMQEKSALPPDFLETARRIDPTNSWFTYQAAALESKEAVNSKSRKSKRVAGKTVYEEPKAWEILDQARFDRALLMLKEARNQPKYTSYSAELLRQRLPLLPEGNLTEKLDAGSCLSTTSGFSSLRLLVLAKAIAAKAWSLGESGDIPGFQEISTDGDLFLRRIYSEQTGILVTELASSAMASEIAGSFSATAEKLGLENADHWKSITTQLSERKERRNSREFIVDGKAVESDTITGGFIMGSIETLARFPDHQPPLSDAELKPQRLLDHEILSWVYSYFTWVVMALCLGFVAAYRFRVAVLSRSLARRMENLLGNADWAWIIGAGILLPFAFVMAVNRLTPLGGRQFGIGGTAWLMPAAHFLGLWLMWFIVSSQIIRWRLEKRAGGLGFRGPSWPGWLAVVISAAFIPMIGWAAISPAARVWLDALKLDSAAAKQMPWMFWGALGLAVISLLWVLWRISVALLGRADRQMDRAATSLVLVRSYAVILLVMAMATVAFKTSERYWFKQETLSKFDLATPGWSVYESKVALQMRKELREILGYGPFEK